MLNLAAAMSGTLAAYPTSLNFATTGGTLQLALSNISGAGDTYQIQVVPTGNSPAPTVITNSVQLDPGATQQVPVTLNASGLAPGEYQGYLTVTGTANGTVTNVPYWFAVPGTTPSSISILYQDFFDPIRSSSSQAVVLRILDVAGLPYTGRIQPQINISGSGAVRAFYRTGTIPGTYAVDIRTGTASMILTFTIGTVSASVTIPVF